MSALELLRQRGPMRAVDIAAALSKTVEDVYAELVPLEGRGEVRIELSYSGLGDPVREWAALDPPVKRSSRRASWRLTGDPVYG